jgi:hypothetical protein
VRGGGEEGDDLVDVGGGVLGFSRVVNGGVAGE